MRKIISIAVFAALMTAWPAYAESARSMEGIAHKARADVKQSSKSTKHKASKKSKKNKSKSKSKKKKKSSGKSNSSSKSKKTQYGPRHTNK